jgi:hypothetical protein
MKGVVLALCLVFVLSVVAVAARPHLHVALPSPLVRHVHFVDQTPDRRNFLFRGGDPNVGRDGKFDYDGLVQSIQLAAERVRVALPSKFYLIDINLTNLEAGGDAPRTIAEWSFFNANPHLGKFIFWETHGTKDNASDPTVPAGLKQYMIEHFPVWQGDQLVTRMAELRTMLYTNFTLPVVLYGHCDCGCDRTGETMGAYYMKWLNYSWDFTNKLNTEFAERPMMCEEYLAMQYYCLYLNHAEGKRLDCLTNHPCTR